MRGRGLAAAALAALALAACGGGEGGPAAEPESGETAALWVTRDRGAEVILEQRVAAGQTVLQALDRKADVETRYGGRFVQAVNGIEGNVDRQEDWFYFLNGIEPDVGSAEVTLHPGDVAWWDYRSWRRSMAQPVVVGAFPEPFLHGWDGKRRPAKVEHPPELADVAGDLLDALGGPEGDGEPNVFVLRLEPQGEGARLTAVRGPRNDSPVTFMLAGSPRAVHAAASALAHAPEIVRFRYEARFDDEGNVVE